MLTDKNVTKIIFIACISLIFYSQIIVWQNYLVEITGKRPELNFMDAEYRFQRGMDSASEEEFQKAVKLDPTNSDIHYKLANYYARYPAGVRLSLAYEEYRKALLFSEEGLRLAIINEIYLNFTQDYVEITGLLPKHAATMYNFAMFLKEKVKNDEAVDVFNQSVILAKRENNVDVELKAYNEMGSIQMQHGKPDEAIENFKKVLIVTPDDESCLRNMGWAYFVKGEINEAKKTYEKALKINPGAGLTYYGLGLVYEGSNFNEDAVSCYKKALRLGLNAPAIEKELNERINSLKQN